MASHDVDGPHGSSILSIAIGAMEEAGSLFGLEPMVQGESCDQPESDWGAYVWMTGGERTLLIGLQCADLTRLGAVLGDDGEEARDTGIDALGELLNVAAGSTKSEITDPRNTISLGLPVFTAGSVAPRVSISHEAVRLRFGELTMVISVVEMDLAPEARARKEEEEKNQQLREELQLAQKLEAVGQLAAGVAHEINTPLQFVGDNIGFLKEAFEDLSTLLAELDSMQTRLGSEEGTKPYAEEIDTLKENADTEFLLEGMPEALDTVCRGMDRVGTVVQALRNVGSAGLMTRQPIDVNELLESTLVVTCSHYEAIADVEQDWAELPRVNADPGQISQVFIQLIINAAEAIQAVNAEDPATARGVIRVATRHENDQVVVEFEDSGCGVPEEIRDRIFDPFFTTKGVGKNMGQGLSTVRTIIVEGHRGKMELHSEEGKGARFTLLLPVGTPTPAKSPLA